MDEKVKFPIKPLDIKIDCGEDSYWHIKPMDNVVGSAFKVIKELCPHCEARWKDSGAKYRKKYLIPYSLTIYQKTAFITDRDTAKSDFKIRKAIWFDYFIEKSPKFFFLWLIISLVASFSIIIFSNDNILLSLANSGFPPYKELDTISEIFNAIIVSVILTITFIFLLIYVIYCFLGYLKKESYFLKVSSEKFPYFKYPESTTAVNIIDKIEISSDKKGDLHSFKVKGLMDEWLGFKDMYSCYLSVPYKQKDIWPVYDETAKKVACQNCGVKILVATATKNNGVCAQCVTIPLSKRNSKGDIDNELTNEEINSEKDETIPSLLVLPPALEKPGKEHVTKKEVVEIIKNHSFEQLCDLIDALPFEALTLDEPDHWTTSHERFLRFCIQMTLVLISYESERKDHPSYGLPDLHAEKLAAKLLEKFLVRIRQQKHDKFSQSARERLISFGKSLAILNYYRDAFECLEFFKKVAKKDHDDLSFWMWSCLHDIAKETQAPDDIFKAIMAAYEVTGDSKSRISEAVVSARETLSQMANNGHIGTEKLVDYKIQMIKAEYLKNADVFQGYEPIVDTIRDELDSLEKLVLALKHNNTFIVAAAAEVLGQFKDKRAVDPLINHVLNKESDLMTWEFTLTKALWALSEIGDSKAINAIEKFVQHEDNDVKMEAESAIEKLRTQNEYDSRDSSSISISSQSDIEYHEFINNQVIFKYPKDWEECAAEVGMLYAPPDVNLLGDDMTGQKDRDLGLYFTLNQLEEEKAPGKMIKELISLWKTTHPPYPNFRLLSVQKNGIKGATASCLAQYSYQLGDCVFEGTYYLAEKGLFFYTMQLFGTPERLDELGIIKDDILSSFQIC
jgi:hypothetical protein